MATQTELPPAALSPGVGGGVRGVWLQLYTYLDTFLSVSLYPYSLPPPSDRPQEQTWWKRVVVLAMGWWKWACPWAEFHTPTHSTHYLQNPIPFRMGRSRDYTSTPPKPHPPLSRQSDVLQAPPSFSLSLLQFDDALQIETRAQTVE